MWFHLIKIRYSTEPRDRIYVKGYGFLSFAKNIGKSLSIKYSQKLAAGDLIGNKIADKITRLSKRSSTELHSKKLENDNTNDELEVPKKIHTSRRKATHYRWIKVSITV